MFIFLLIFLNHLISIHFIGISYLRFTQCLYYMKFVHIYEWIWLLSWPISLVNSFILFNESFICLFFWYFHMSEASPTLFNLVPTHISTLSQCFLFPPAINTLPQLPPGGTSDKWNICMNRLFNPFSIMIFWFLLLAYMLYIFDYCFEFVNIQFLPYLTNFALVMYIMFCRNCVWPLF